MLIKANFNKSYCPSPSKKAFMYILLFPGGNEEVALFHLPAQAHMKHIGFK